MDKVSKASLFLVAMCIMAAGCSNPNAVPAHTAADDAAINKYKTMTPQEKIDALEKGPMPEGAKKAQIAKIKAEAHLP